MIAFFERGDDPDVLLPQTAARAGWGDDHLRGLAVSGALARAVEAHAASVAPGLVPVRWSVDLFRPAGRAATTTSVSVIKSGRRLCLLEATLHQRDRDVARATALYLAPSDSPTAASWDPGLSLAPPPDDHPAIGSIERLYRIADGDWVTPDLTPMGAEPTVLWQYPIEVVAGEELSPFQAAACFADIANAAINIGAAGLQFLNTDLTLVLGRLPVSLDMGMRPLSRTEHAGISTGVAGVFDRVGMLGTVTMCALANVERAVDIRRLGEWTGTA